MGNSHRDRGRLMVFLGCVSLGLCLVVLPTLQTIPVSRSFNHNQSSFVKTYPTVATAPASTQYAVTINGKPVFVERYNGISYVHFAFAGKVDLTVTMLNPQGNYQVSPKRRVPSVWHQGNQLIFSLNQPQKLIVHNRDFEAEQLFILADAWETAQIPQPATNLLSYNLDNTGQQDVTPIVQRAIDDVAARRGVLYIPAGLYQIQQLNLKSNLTLYLAGGAILQATRQTLPAYGQGLINLRNVHNVKICGPGTIVGHGSYWRPKGGWYSLVNIEQSQDVTVQDVLLRDPAVANIWMEHAQNVRVENSKILADPQPQFLNTDGVGIWSSQNVTIDDILYRGTDDATTQGGDKSQAIQNNENINIKNSVFAIFESGGAFKLGSTIEQDLIQRVTYENIDVVHTEEIAGFWPVAGGRIADIYLKNIHVEAIANQDSISGGSRLFEWRVMEANWEKNSSADRLGSLRHVYVSNLRVQNLGRNPSLFQGYSANQNVSDIVFDNFFFQDRLVNQFSQVGFRQLPSDRDEQVYVSNFSFIDRELSLVNIQTIPGKGFQITRTGDITTPLTIPYQIRGTAQNGVDYQTINQQVTIPAGATTAVIPILPMPPNVAPTTVKTVQIRLENRPHSLQYLLDTKFQDVLLLFV